MNSGAISGSNNGHPGRLLEDGTYSDARAMSLLELLIVSSLPEDIKLPPDVSEKVVREIIGEGVPPKMSMAFLKMLTKDNV
jgi:DNA (cytosine-5)-methyltransferase 1